MELTPDQIDALKELINIGVGRAAGVLNEMTQSHIHLQVPFIKIVSPEELKMDMGDLDRGRLSSVQLGFKGSFSGIAALIFPTDSAAKLVAVITGDERTDTDLDSLRIGTLTEVGNIVLNGVMGSIGNVLEHRINYSVPTYMEDTINNLLFSKNPVPNAMILLAQTRFTIEQLQVQGDIMLFFDVGSLDTFIATIDKSIQSNLGV